MEKEHQLKSMLKIAPQSKDTKKKLLCNIKLLNLSPVFKSY
jgi:hypothetical protein